MFTTKHFIWIGICILFILIMNHYAKKEDFTNHFEQCICFVDKAIEAKDDFVLQNNDTKLDNTIVHTKRFILSEDESYSIAIFHKEIYKGKKVLFLDGEPFHCKVFVVHKKQDKVKSYIVRA